MPNDHDRGTFPLGFKLLRIQIVLLLMAIAGGTLMTTYLLFAVPGSQLKHVLIRNSSLSVLVLVIVSIVVYFFYDKQVKREGQRIERQRQLQSHVFLGLFDRQSLEPDSDRGHEIQMKLLPRETPQLEGFQIACAWQPARSVSGDYFDVLPLGRDQVGMCVADVSGKGVAAALLMAELEASVKTFAREGVSPAALCSKLNGVLCENIAPGRYVTLFYAVLDAENRTLQYESAGHCLPLLVHANGTIELPEASSGVLGLFSHWTYSDHQLTLARGDVLVMMTDGLLEAWNAEEEEFGYRRLIDSVLANRAQGAHGIRQRVLDDVTKFCGGVFRDDVSLIVVTVE